MKRPIDQIHLLDIGHISTHDGDENTLLRLLVEEAECKLLLALLIKNNTFVNAMNKGGWTPLSVAARRGHEIVVKVLVVRDEVEQV